jgi:hypothetical protein
MLEVWQNLAPIDGRPIGGAIEALLTKVVNLQLSVLLIAVFFLAAAVSCHDQMATLSMMR